MRNVENNKTYHYKIKDLVGVASAHTSTEDEKEEDNNPKVAEAVVGDEAEEIKLVVSDIVSEAEMISTKKAELSISWQTNKPANSVVYINDSEVKDTELSQSHTVVVKDLEPDKKYVFRVGGSSESGAELARIP